MKKFHTILALLVSSLNIVFAQQGYEYSPGIKVLYSTVFDGDTIPVINIPEVNIVSHNFDNKEDKYWYEYYLKRVKKVYPYFEIAREVVAEFEHEKSNSKKKEYKKFRKDRKEELMNEFEKELRDLTVSQGKVLVKMINRDTGTAFYDLIKEYNTGIKAWAYNVVAKKYGYNLKEDYDPNATENRMLELAIKTVEQNYQSNKTAQQRQQLRNR
jgi:hypothetical protein